MKKTHQQFDSETIQAMSKSSPDDSIVVLKPTLLQLFENEETPLLRYAFSLVGRRVIAEEIVQDAFLQLHAHWETVENPVAWLFRSVRNRSYNHHRDHKRETLSDEAEALSSESPDSPEDLLHRMEAAGFLRLLVSELEEADRQLIDLKYFQDLKYREISERTGLSIGNVGYRLHHVLKQLAEKLQQLGIEGNQ
ncbi:RNA polymerase sigma factor [Verrucomicrobiales bacterium]|nr:RNA polymerase sigma factor [Verrucomicrobiales bacterium]MDB4358752.1 RNA polymerase sigma factor [Verrucomicrobiales bacterium]